MSKVFCYRNLHHKGVIWSVRDVKSGLVIDRSPTVFLKDVALKVSKAGRARVLREKRKNVHAGVQGFRLKGKPRNINWRPARYNPYLFDSFILATGAAIYAAEYVMLNKLGLFIGGEIELK